MSRVAYVDGLFVPHSQAVIPMDDRGYHFADGAYEVFSYNRHQVFVDAIPHFNRLRASLQSLRIPYSFSDQSLLLIMHELMRQNRCREGFLYLQITRGVAPREHVVPGELRPMMTLFARAMKFKKNPPLLRVFTEPDIRWKRNDIKAIALLGNILSKSNSAKKGGDEAWLVNERGEITEGSATNAWIVTQEGVIRTHPTSPLILNGIVRQRLLKLAAQLNIRVEERAFSLEEALKSSEAFLTSSTKGVHPVVSINSHLIGAGEAGPVTKRLHEAYWQFQDALEF